MGSMNFVVEEIDLFSAFSQFLDFPVKSAIDFGLNTDY